MYFSVGGSKSVAETSGNQNPYFYTNSQSLSLFFLPTSKAAMAGLAPPGSAQVGGAEGGPLWTPRFSSSRGAVQRSRGAAAYPAGCMVIRALGLRLVIVIRHVDYVVSPCSLDG